MFDTIEDFTYHREWVRGAELAEPQRAFTEDAAAVAPPALDDRIYRDNGEYVRVDATVVPGTIEPGASARAHVSFVPNETIKAHWNNEVDDLVFWVEAPDGWQALLRGARALGRKRRKRRF